MKLLSKIFGRNNGGTHTSGESIEALTADKALEKTNNYGHDIRKAVRMALHGVESSANIGRTSSRITFWDEYSEELRQELVGELLSLGYRVTVGTIWEHKKDYEEAFIEWGEEDE